MYNSKLLDHFENPRNAGDVPEASYTIQCENPVCGDQLRLTLSCNGNAILRVGFRARGCTASIACASALTELLQGLERDKLSVIRATEIEAAVGGLLAESKHAAVLCEDAVKQLETQWKMSSKT